MSKFKLSASLLKVLLPVLVVVIGVVAAVFPFNTTGAFFTSALAAINNPLQTGDWVPPEPPLFWVEEDQTQVKIEWLPVSDAVSYNLYRSTDNSTFSLLTTVSSPTLSYEDTALTTETEYFYKVTAVDAASNETSVASINAKRAFTKDIVIDDDAVASDFGSSGTVSATGVWDTYGAHLSGYAGAVLQNAVGGDNHSTGASATDQTYTWQTAGNLDGTYEVFVQYICDTNRGIAHYDVLGGATVLNAEAIEIYQSRLDGLAASSPCGSQPNVSQAGPTWVSLGSFGFADVTGSVTLTAPAGEAYIIADAVAFHRTGDYISTEMALGFATAETEAGTPRSTDVSVDPYGYCPVITNDTSMSGAAIQKLNWTEVAGTTSYRLDGFVWNGSSWDQAYDNFDIAVGDPSLTTSGGVVTYTSQATAEGKYAYRVEALGSSSQVLASSPAVSDSTTCTFTVDRTPPVSTIAVTGGDTYQIENRVKNGGFESDLVDWQTVGDVAVITGAENGATPFGTKMVRIGDQSSGIAPVGNAIDVNILSQTIPHVTSGSDTGVKTIGFWYNFMTYEGSVGFDEPGFMVFVGDKMVHQIWASDIPGFDGSSGTLDQTGWRFLSIDVSDQTNPTLTLAFYAGNTGDLTRQSFVYVDNVTTNEVAISSAAEFVLSATDNVAVNQVFYEYQVSGTPVSGSGANGLTFTLSAQPDDGIVEYWASDTAGNVEARNRFQVSLDDDAPDAITDLSAHHEGNGDFTLEWTAPNDANPYGVDQAGEYDLRYSTSPIDLDLDLASWESLAKPAVYTTDGLPGGSLRAPLAAGRPESYLVHVDDGPATYYFALRAKDRAGNLSPLVAGSIASDTAEATVTHQLGDVVINEVMWMGSAADPTDEWIELKNMTDQDIDISGWVIEKAGVDDATYELPAGTILPGSNFVVIARQSAASTLLKQAPTIENADIDLDDAGEQLVLKTSPSGVVIDHTPTGAWAAGENTAVKRSMERHNIPDDGTNTHSWHSCDSPSCADARSLYWQSVGDTYGTPGGANLSFESEDVVVELELTPIDADHLTFTIENVAAYTALSYIVEYTHLGEEGEIRDALMGAETLTLGTRSFTSEPLYLGTCSTNGESCVSHAPATDIKVTVTLQGPDMTERVVTADLLTLP